VAVAIKTAREVALLPYTQRTVSERGPGRGPRPPRGEAAEQLAEGEVALEEIEGLPELEDLDDDEPELEDSEVS
jgi:hypothetical protein